jgi:glutaredoxin 3
VREQTKRVRIFTTPTCPWCDNAKRFCAENGVEYTEVDVMGDRHGFREMVLMTGQHGVPVVVVGEKAIVGWDAGEFRRLMGWNGERR